MRSPIFFVLLAALALAPASALATHPDHEGERGPELQVALGYGLFGSTDDRVFQPSTDFTVGNNPLDAFGGGFALRVSGGYRFLPYLSAGAHVGWVFPSATGQLTSGEQRMGASDTFSSFTFGLYARLYFLALANGARANPRVFFTGPLDLRRFDPYIALGVDAIAGVSRGRTYASPNRSLVDWSTSYVGVPIELGAAYRVTTRLALGVTLGVTPLIAASTVKSGQTHDFSPGRDVVTSFEDTYTPASSANVQLFFGLSARYTFTYW